MSLRNLLFVTLFVGTLQTAFGQHNYRDYNRLGVSAGLSLFDINTSDLVTQQGNGFTGGFHTRGAFYNFIDLIWGLDFYQNNLDVAAFNPEIANGTAEFLKYTHQSVQLKFLGSANLIQDYVTIEAGPVLNINGKLKLDNDNFEDYIVGGYQTLRASEIQDISKVNFHVMGGITVGVERFRVSAQYQYGVTNTLKNLNDKELENSDFKGTASLFAFKAIFYF